MDNRETNQLPSFTKNRAGKLARLRQIESDYPPQEGGFDWESLPAEIQDEYDVLCVSLGSYQNSKGNATWEDYQAQRTDSES